LLYGHGAVSLFTPSLKPPATEAMGGLFFDLMNL
jgi:hypothetical protein